MSLINSSTQPGTARQIPFRRALLWIILWTLMVSGTTAGSWALWCHFHRVRMQSPRYAITKIAQPGPLPTSALAEWIGLSVAHPTNLYALDLQEARHRLESVPYIVSANVGRLPPDTLRVGYTALTPIARAGNEGVAINGVRVSLHPFFVGDDLPALFGDDPIGLAVITAAQRFGVPVQAVDVSRTTAPTAGRREIVLHLPNAWLRLPVVGWQAALQRYQLLAQRVLPDYDLVPGQRLVVDLRLNQLAYLTREPDSAAVDHRSH